MKKRIFYILVPITTFILVFVILDILIGSLYLPEVRRYRQPHEYYHHSLVPNVSNVYSKWANQIYKISTNSLGFRDSVSRNIPKRSDMYRIIFMGDSFAEGIGVNWEDSFVGIISNRLEEKDIEILNAGVIGYSPKIYYLKTKHLLNIEKLNFDELFVFIDMSDVQNEHIYQNYEPKSFIDRFIQSISRYSFVLRKVRQPPALSVIQGIPFANDLNKNYDFQIEHWEIENPQIKEGFRLGFNNMIQLVELCRKHKIKLRLIVYPWQNNIGDKKHLQETAWRNFAKTHNVEFISLFSDFAKACNYDGKFCDNFFIPLDSHWSIDGHKFVANKILERF